MAITELIFPKIKTDQASLEEIQRGWPVFSKKLTTPNPGALCAFRGWILTEDGRDVREEHREFLLFEWEKLELFQAFVVSDQFKAFAGSIRHLVYGPPTLQLFETNLSPKDAASASSIEIFRVTVSNAETGEAALQIWETVSQTANETYGEKVSVTYGKSQNLDDEVVVGIMGWKDPVGSVPPASGGTVLSDLLEPLKNLGELSSITVTVDAMELPPL